MQYYQNNNTTDLLCVTLVAFTAPISKVVTHE